jgi:hypothetical protein
MLAFSIGHLHVSSDYWLNKSRKTSTRYVRRLSALRLLGSVSDLVMYMGFLVEILGNRDGRAEVSP